VFTVEQRDALRDRVLSLAEVDPRVVSGAVVGSLARGDGDQYSDLDLTFVLADDVAVAEVLDDWTGTLSEELEAVALLDLEHGATTYRVLLLPEALQLDLSFTPAGGVAPETVQPQADDVFGWGVVYGLHARACIERGRVWQAEHYIGAVRDRALTLACLRRGLPAVQARGYDELPAEVLAELDESHVGSLQPDRLRTNLSAAIAALLREGEESGVSSASAVAQRLAELAR
jgi:predicted nucleotidyltransferase